MCRMILSCAGFGASAMPLATAGSSFDASKLCPGTIPIVASFATIGASSAAGGLVFISSLNSLK